MSYYKKYLRNLDCGKGKIKLIICIKEKFMNIEKIQTQFNLIAKAYDENRRKFISCFDDYYINTTDFLSNFIGNPKNILDLGSGTGLLPSFWYKHFPESNYILCDIADEMLEIAKERFKGCSNVNYEVLDYSKELPAQNADLVISALSIHHLEHEQKKNLFKSIYEKLPENGYFVNYDQFCVEDKFLNKQIEEFWIKEIINSGISETEYERWLDRKKLDRESTINEELSWLKQAGFKMTECIYSKGKFAVLLAGK